MHNAQEKDYKCDQWKNGDVIGLACDLDKMQVHVSLNGHVSLSGSFAAPTRRKGKSLEIVFVSSDHDDEAFASYPFASYHEEMAGAAVCKGLEADAR